METTQKIDRALGVVAALCAPKGSPGARQWTMSIPARPDSDPDLVIADALSSARRDLAAALERVEALTWRPIETAPLSHLLPWESPQHPILVATSEGRVFESRCCCPTPSVANLRSGEKATHWMPLPDPPTPATGAEEAPHE